MRKLVLFASPFALAALLYVYLLSVSVCIVLGTVSLIGCLVFCFVRFEKHKQIAIITAGLAVGFLWCFGYEILHLQPIWKADGQQMQIHAVVRNYPIKTQNSWRVDTEVQINNKTAKTAVYLKDGCTAEPGDTIVIQAVLYSTQAVDKDDDRYLISTGYALRAYGKEASVIKCEKTPLRFLPAVFSHRLQAALTEAVPKDAAPFLQALITGNRTEISTEHREEITAAGFSHILAVSGMHVSILMSILYVLTQKNSVLSAILGIPMLLFFLVMTGGSPSVVRAVIMQIIVLMAPVLYRETDRATSICAAMLVLLMANPNVMASVSFQLSFGSIFGIYFYSEKIYAASTKPTWTQKLLDSRWTRKIAFFVFSCLSSTLSALLFTVPLIAIHFGRISLYAVLSNILVLGVISFCFAGGLLTGILGMLWPAVAKLLGWVVAWPIRYILWVADKISHLPYAALSASTPYISFWLIFAYLIIAFALLRKEKKTFFSASVCILTGLLVSLAYTHFDASYGDFSITVLDVGQGACVCMQATDYAAMVDCGGDSGNSAAKKAIEHVQLATSGKLDCLLITHYDADHSNGAEKLLTEVEVDTLYLPKVTDDSGMRAKLEATARSVGTEIVYVTQDISVDFTGGRMQMLAPVSYYDDNAACLSVLFSVSEYDMLITGDMDFFSEYDLLLQHRLPDVELYLAGHHGAASSSSVELLEQIRPETVIISVGENNRYGHPTQEAIARFIAVGAEIYSTDTCGTITIGR